MPLQRVHQFLSEGVECLFDFDKILQVYEKKIDVKINR